MDKDDNQARGRLSWIFFWLTEAAVILLQTQGPKLGTEIGEVAGDLGPHYWDATFWGFFGLSYSSSTYYSSPYSSIYLLKHIFCGPGELLRIIAHR